MAPSRRKTHVWWGLALLIGVLASSPPAGAGDTPSLQDFLGRAQTQTERKAVEDLVEKLQGAARKPAPSAPAPAPAPAPASTTAAPVPEPAEPPAPTASPAPPPAAPPEKSASPATVTPQAAVESAEKKQRPSVDLEVFFDYDAARITPQAASVLSTLGRALVDARLADDAFLIAGHTDAKGGDDYNLALSERRAEAVRQFLIDNFKIEPGKLVAKGFGRQRLKNPKLPLAGENRRVQIVNLSK
ncbi:MAG TPA: OmpA family protein [Hyphomicrobiaceae bacterium]|nr:OmpA family protein [Hyphomicrobiaceae bacterium]